MKTIKYISALLVVSSTLLSSCSLLVSSPLPSSRPRPHPHPHPVAHGGSSYGGSRKNSKVYNDLFRVSVEGGTYEFDCANDQFYIAKIYDSSILLPDMYTNYDSYTPTASDFIPVNDLTFDGSFYTITCNRDKNNWVITIDPLKAMPGELNEREVWVHMWDESDNYNFVFKFEQREFLEYIQ